MTIDEAIKTVRDYINYSAKPIPMKVEHALDVLINKARNCTSEKARLERYGMKQYKLISCCGDCAMYDLKKHRCTAGAEDEGTPQDNFYADCPLKDGKPLDWSDGE